MPATFQRELRQVWALKPSLGLSRLPLQFDSGLRCSQHFSFSFLGSQGLIHALRHTPRAYISNTLLNRSGFGCFSRKDGWCRKCVFYNKHHLERVRIKSHFANCPTASLRNWTFRDCNPLSWWCCLGNGSKKVAMVCSTSTATTASDQSDGKEKQQNGGAASLLCLKENRASAPPLA